MKFVDTFTNLNIEWSGKVRLSIISSIKFKQNFLSFPATLDSTKIIEVLDPDTVVCFQVHKRVWPAAQRDSCLWSHIRCISKSEEDQPTWLVVNYTTPHSLAPVSDSCDRSHQGEFSSADQISTSSFGRERCFNLRNNHSWATAKSTRSQAGKYRM